MERNTANGSERTRYMYVKNNTHTCIYKLRINLTGLAMQFAMHFVHDCVSLQFAKHYYSYIILPKLVLL